MELIAAVAAGLNPYVGILVLGSLAAFTRHVPAPAAPELATVVLPAIILLAALAAPVDLVLSKFVRYAPRVRSLSQAIAPLAGGGGALLTTQGDLPAPLVVAGAALLSWSVAAMLTSAAARASRSPAWVGLGHVPVLMGAATLAACLVPLGVARVPLGLVPASGAVLVLLLVTLSGARHRLAHPSAHGVRRRALPT